MSSEIVTDPPLEAAGFEVVPDVVETAQHTDSLSAPTRIETSGDQAYVVVPAIYSFKERGVAMRESAQMTFALRKGSSGWLIHSWTWTGPKPQRAEAPAKK